MSLLLVFAYTIFMNSSEIVDLLQKYRSAYYSGNPLISDEEFDELEKYLTEIDPENEYFDTVGIELSASGKQKVRHLIRMKSMQKVVSIEGLEKWINNTFDIFPEFVIEPKIDGMSCTLHYNSEGDLALAATRGDGNTGINITQQVLHIPTVPKKVKVKDIEVRGEIYLSKNNSFSKPGEPLRNVAVGLVNRKEDGIEDCKHLSFIAYEILGPSFGFVTDKLKYLKDLGFATVDILNASSVFLLDRAYKTYLEELRGNWPFETDGLIIQPNSIPTQKKYEGNNDHHSLANCALKSPSQMQISTLIDIEWNITRYGNLIPTAIFEPISILNRTLQRASLSNYSNVLKLSLEKNDKILIKLANDVIPYVVKNVTKDTN